MWSNKRDNVQLNSKFILYILTKCKISKPTNEQIRIIIDSCTNIFSYSVFHILENLRKGFKVEIRVMLDFNPLKCFLREDEKSNLEKIISNCLNFMCTVTIVEESRMWNTLFEVTYIFSKWNYRDPHCQSRTHQLLHQMCRF